QRRLLTMLFGGFAGIAVGVAAVGVYWGGLYNVAERGQGVGIRRALGGERGGVLGMGIGQGRVAGVFGGGSGRGVAFFVGRGLCGLLFDISRFDLATYAVVPLLLGVVALLAIYVPARRAMRVDPIAALKYE